MPDLIQEESYTDAAAFLDALNPSKARWCKADYPTWIFRGQWEGSVDPIPSVWRKTNRELVLHGFKKWKEEHEEDGAEEALDAFVAYQEGEWSKSEYPRLRDHIEFCIGERWLLPKFAEMAIKIALSVGEPPHKVASPGRSVIRAHRRAKQKPPQWPKWPFTRMVSPVSTFAQHHRIPTRLLDWTWNPYVAAYFAADDDTSEANSSEELGVWAIRPRSMQDEVTLYHASAALHAFARAQEGVFTKYSHFANRQFMTKGSWPSLIDAVESLGNSKQGPVLYKMTLPHTETSSLLKKLYFLRCHRARLMPTHDNVARHLRESWELDISP